MNRNHQIAQLLVACWVLSKGEEKIPTSHGLLDRALKAVCEINAFPEWVCKELNFVDSRIGLQCIELPTILDWAQKAQLTTAPNPSYQFTEIQISEWVAKKLLHQLNVSTEDAIKWGNLLQKNLKKEEDQLANFDLAVIE